MFCLLITESVLKRLLLDSCDLGKENQGRSHQQASSREIVVSRAASLLRLVRRKCAEIVGDRLLMHLRVLEILNPIQNQRAVVPHYSGIYSNPVNSLG
jgi:hypothetical protein